MPIPVPNLDDRTFDQLVTEARALIPQHFPAWTDHNASDPDITLLELFAFFFEAAIYQINRIPERSLEHFAALVGVTRDTGEAIESTLRRALGAVAGKYRAITASEFEHLATQAPTTPPVATQAPTTPPGTIARAKAVIQVVPTPHVFPDEQCVQVVIVPNEPQSPAPTPTPELCQTVFHFLRSRRLITTRVQVVPPTYTGVRIATTVVRSATSRFSRDAVQHNVEQTIRTFVNPLMGGEDGTGWEFGRSVFRSELYQRIEGLVEVDHVQRLLLNGNDAVGALPLQSPTALVALDELTVTVVDV